MANISGWMIYPVDDVTEFYCIGFLRYKLLRLYLKKTKKKNKFSSPRIQNQGRRYRILAACTTQSEPVQNSNALHGGGGGGGGEGTKRYRTITIPPITWKTRIRGRRSDSGTITRGWNEEDERMQIESKPPPPMEDRTPFRGGPKRRNETKK